MAEKTWSAEYLQEFLWRIVPGRSMRSMDDEVIAEFFREHPEHWEKIWALFTVEGAMPSNGLALWFIYDAQLTICGHDLLVYLARIFRSIEPGSSRSAFKRCYVIMRHRTPAFSRVPLRL